MNIWWQYTATRPKKTQTRSSEYTESESDMKYQDRQVELNTEELYAVQWDIAGEGWVTFALIGDPAKAAYSAALLTGQGYRVRLLPFSEVPSEVAK